MRCHSQTGRWHHVHHMLVCMWCDQALPQPAHTSCPAAGAAVGPEAGGAAAKKQVASTSGPRLGHDEWREVTHIRRFMEDTIVFKTGFLPDVGIPS